MADELQYTRLSTLLSMQNGQAGVDNLATTTATTPGGGASEWFAIQAIGTTVIASLTESDSTGNMTGVTLSDGFTIFGTFTAITLTSGRVRLYREPIS